MRAICLFLLIGLLTTAAHAQTAKEWFAKGMATSDHDLEVEYFSKVIELDPTYSRAHFNRGVAKRALGQNEAALLDYDRAIELEPDFAPAYNNRGVVRNSLGRYRAALEDYDKTIALDVAYARAYLNKGQTLVKLGRYRDVLAAFAKGEELDKTITFHLDDKKLAQQRLGGQGSPQTAKEWFEKGETAEDLSLQVDYFSKAIELDPAYPRAYFKRAEAYWQLKRYQQAVNDYDRAVRLEPDFANAWWGRGDARKRLGRLADALTDYDKAIELDDKVAGMFNSRGDLRYDQKLYAQAIGDFNRAIAINADYAEAYNNRGNSRYALGYYQTALADYNKAIELDEKMAVAYLNKGQTLVKLTQYRDALAAFAEGEELDNTLTYHLDDKKLARERLGLADETPVAKPGGTAKEWFDKGMATSDHNLEVEYFSKVIELDPTYSRAHFNRGVAKRALGQNEAALLDYDRAIELEPDFGPAYNNRGVVRNNLGRYQAALEDYDKSIALDAAYARAYCNKGQTLVKLGRYQDALDAFAKGEELDKTITFHLDDKKLVQQRLNAGGKPVLTAKEWFDKGMATSDHNLEVEYFSKVIELDPTYSRAYYNRAGANRALGRNEAALADFDRAVEVEPDYANAWWGRANAKKNLGKPQEALLDYDRAVELDPKNAAIINSRGSLHDDLGRYDAAIADYNQAISLDPRYAFAYNNRGYTRYNQGRYQAALTDYDKAIELDAAYARAYLNKGQALVKLGRYQDALDAFDKGELHDKTLTYHLDDKKLAQQRLKGGTTTVLTAKEWFDKGMATSDHTLEVAYFSKVIELDPSYLRAHFNRAIANNALGRTDEALADYTRAIELEPNYAQAYNNRGLVKYKLGRYEAALADYDRANLLDAAYAKAWFNRGQTLVRLGRYADALAAFAKGEGLDKAISYHLDDKKLAQERMQTSNQPKRYALVIGNSTYRYGTPLKGNPVNDAQDMAARLRKLGFTVTVVTDADNATLRRVMRDFRNQIKRAEVALLFYAGHGMGHRGGNYLLPIDAELHDPVDVRDEAINVQDCLDDLKQSGATFNIAVIDACRSEVFRNYAADDRGDDDRGFRPIQSNSLIGGQQQGNIYLVMATGWGSVAQNGTGRNGVYTESLLKFMQPGEELRWVLDQAAVEVGNRTGFKQMPEVMTQLTVAKSLKF